MLFGAGHNDRRVKKEQSHRNHQLIKTIKDSEVETK